MEATIQDKDYVGDRRQSKSRGLKASQWPGPALGSPYEGAIQDGAFAF